MKTQRLLLAIVNHVSNKKGLETLKMNSGSQENPSIESSDKYCRYDRSTHILRVYWIEIFLKFFTEKRNFTQVFIVVLAIMLKTK
jgi:hypothetical protein